MLKEKIVSCKLRHSLESNATPTLNILSTQLGKGEVEKLKEEKNIKKHKYNFKI